MEGQTNINVTEIVDAELLLERFFIHIQLKFVVLCLQIQPFNFSVPKKINSRYIFTLCSICVFITFTSYILYSFPIQ